MARIEHLNISITDLPPDALMNLVMEIRANRRKRPVKAQRKSNAQAKRTTARKRAPSQQDVFAMVDSMSPELKKKIAQQLLKGDLK
jgi:hypothetical protein